MCCYLIPVTCCGPPVIYSKEPKLCGLVSLAPCCGVPIYYAPTNCFGLKTYLCCGQPCYTSCAAGLVGGLTPEGADTLLAAMSVPSQKTTSTFSFFFHNAELPFFSPWTFAD